MEGWTRPVVGRGVTSRKLCHGKGDNWMDSQNIFTESVDGMGKRVWSGGEVVPGKKKKKKRPANFLPEKLDAW